MPLTIPKQQFTAALAHTNIAAPVSVPMMQVSGELAFDPVVDASFAVPMQSIYGVRPEITAVLTIPMQQVEAAMFQPTP